MPLLLGSALALLIGLLLGLMGGGGSILTTPALVYFFHTPPTLATAYSLFVVGISAAVGVVARWRSRTIDVRAALVFAPPSLIAVYLMRRYIIPAIPATFTILNGVSIDKEKATLVALAVALIIVGVLMFWPARRRNTPRLSASGWAIALDGVGVGLLAGALGAGGGFLIVPTLTLRARLPIDKAVGASLLVIAFNSAFGFAGDWIAGQRIDWGLLTPFTALVSAGAWAGSRVARHIPNIRLKTGFGVLLLAVGLYIVYREMASPLIVRILNPS